MFESGLVAHHLSTYIRNKRHLDKVSLKKTQKEDDPESSQQSRKRNASARSFAPAAAVSELNKRCAEELDAEVAKLKSDNELSPHVKKLLEESLPIRRDWIKNNCDEHDHFGQILAHYPVLASPSVILYETMLIRGLKVVPEEAATNLFEKLGLTFNLACENDVEKIKIALHLYQRLKPKNTAKGVPAPFQVEEVGSSLDVLASGETKAPRLLVFSDADEKTLVAAFVVADQKIKVKIKEPTATKALCVYIAAHHEWDAEYPHPYFSTLAFIDKEIWGTPLKQPVPKPLSVFYREFKST